jgi:hypothetical protein
LYWITAGLDWETSHTLLLLLLDCFTAPGEGAME